MPSKRKPCSAKLYNIYRNLKSRMGIQVPEYVIQEVYSALTEYIRDELTEKDCVSLPRICTFHLTKVEPHNYYDVVRNAVLKGKGYYRVNASPAYSLGRTINQRRREKRKQKEQETVES